MLSRRGRGVFVVMSYYNPRGALAHLAGNEERINGVSRTRLRLLRLSRVYCDELSYRPARHVEFF